MSIVTDSFLYELKQNGFIDKNIPKKYYDSDMLIFKKGATNLCN